MNNKYTKMGRQNRHRGLSAALLLVLVGFALPVGAIPSPDLVINLSASVAQLLGLLSVVFGGFAMSRKKGGKKRKNNGSSKRMKTLLLVVSVLLIGSFASNLLQYTGSVDAKNARLQTNLVRKSIENGAAVGDVNLKTLSFSQQLQHPQGISTDTLAEWLAAGEPLNIIDVREDEEFEMGAIDGAQHVRYPDLLAQSSLIPENTNTLLLCYSGNRSSELCTEFTKQGKSCNFMMGGYEKWMTESRKLGDNNITSLEQLRGLPDYPNKEVLLDTPDVQALVTNEKAEFVDARYPGDFVKGHLPNAHNITMRALGTDVLDERIAALPDDVPLIGACYDKRSCFYSQVIGLRMSRAGKDYRGRYTVPHEFYVPSGGERAHVSAWKADQEQLTLASYVVTPMRAVLDKLVDVTGHYAIGLLAVVFLIRLLLLPLAMKADRDTAVQKSLSGQISALKEKLSDHPRALSEATMALYSKYRIRPMINMLASVFQLSLLLLFYSAVSQSAVNWPHGLGWISVASEPDPYMVLPILASALFVGVLAVQTGVKTRRKAALLVLGGVALLWLLTALGAAVNLYLAISMAFLIGQSLLSRAVGERLGWTTAGHDKINSIEDTGIVPLSQAHWLPESTGKKAARLGELIEAGYNVPDGFVFTSVITNRLNTGKATTAMLSKEQQKRLSGAWSKLKTQQVAVRSSGSNEDGEDNSFAGVYESILNVKRETLLEAVTEVYSSLGSDRSNAYTSHTANQAGMEAERDEGGVVVQKMVPAQYAGVMFTEHPGNTGAMMIEMVTGLGEDLVSGNVTPDTLAYGKLSGDFFADESSCEKEPDIDMQPLLKLGRELETLFGQPQDIEWAYAKGKFYLLQARDITRSIASGQSLKNLAESERRKLLGFASDSFEVKKSKGKKKEAADKVSAQDKPVFVQNELSELLPRPTPLSADLMERLWAAGGSTDLACQELGIPYNVNFHSVPYITTAFGWTYVNRQEERRRLGKGPGAMAAFQLARNAEAVEAAFRDDFLPQFQMEMIERNAIAMEKLTLEAAVQLLDNWVNRFVEDTYCQAELINISADYHTKNALTKLEAEKLEPAKYLNSHEDNVVTRAMSLLKSEHMSRENIEEFLLTFGHRAPLDYELSEPRFNEDMKLVGQYIQRSSKDAAQSAEADVRMPSKKVLAISIDRARRFQNLKEEAKHYCLIELSQIRQLLLCIDRLCELDGRVFFLHIDEVTQLNDARQRQALQRVADQRFTASTGWQKLQLPASLSVSDLERIDMMTGRRPDAVVATEMSGKRVAGEAEVTGRVRVITDFSEIDSFQQGEILVARMTDPTWYPLFSQARGIITEVGGWLSHAAIVAREYDLPAIVGVNNICQQLNTGDVVTLHLDGSLTRMDNRRDETSPMRNNGEETATGEELDAQIARVYQLSDHRLGLIQRRIERRASKHVLTDRRKEQRYNEDGEMQLDRRSVNRAAQRAGYYQEMFRNAS